ncbi:MAG: YciI family protein [Pseudomonadota bacterium]
MQYMMMFFEPATTFAERDDPSRAPDYWGAWKAYIDSLVSSGAMVSGNGLEPPSTATTVRLANGERLVQDGPAAATKEQLGGYVVLDVADLDAALTWAARCPAAASGAVEVRPVMPSPSA